MTDINSLLAEMEAKAKAAPDQIYIRKGRTLYNQNSFIVAECATGCFAQGEYGRQNAEHIAASCPTNVLALIAECRRLCALLKENKPCMKCGKLGLVQVPMVSPYMCCSCDAEFYSLVRFGKWPTTR